MYSDDDTPEDAYDLFYEIGMDDARLENRLYAEPKPFPDSMFQDEDDFVDVTKPFVPETEADVRIRITLGLRNEYGMPLTKKEADYMAEQSRLEGLAMKKWIAEETERERQEFSPSKKKEAA